LRAATAPGSRVVMQRPNEQGYCRPDAYLVDDVR
jgi:hypothetical protein